jgi:DinB superfamily
MQPKISARFAQLERQRDAFLEQLTALSEAQRHFKANPRSWCALEVAEHLLTVEIGLSKPFLNGEKPEAVTIRSQVIGWLLIAGLNTRTRVKTPSKSAIPQRIPTLEEVRERWKNHHEKMRAHLESLPATALSSAAMNHPLVKPMTLAQSLAFFTAHARHHVYQLGRIQQEVNFPGGGQVD